MCRMRLGLSATKKCQATTYHPRREGPIFHLPNPTALSHRDDFNLISAHNPSVIIQVDNLIIKSTVTENEHIIQSTVSSTIINAFMKTKKSALSDTGPILAGTWCCLSSLLMFAPGGKAFGRKSHTTYALRKVFYGQIPVYGLRFNFEREPTYSRNSNHN